MVAKLEWLLIDNLHQDRPERGSASSGSRASEPEHFRIPDNDPLSAAPDRICRRMTKRANPLALHGRLVPSRSDVGSTFHVNRVRNHIGGPFVRYPYIEKV